VIRFSRPLLACLGTIGAVCVLLVYAFTPINRAQRALGSVPPGVNRSGLNVLLITLDTTRADHLGAYGFQSISTPNIDRLAREGILFEQTITAAPLTLPAHASLFTGRFPPGHGIRDNIGFVLDPHETTMAEILRRQGYRTGAFVGSYVLASSRGLNLGFDTYRDSFPSVETGRALPGGLRRRASDVTAEAESWIAGAGSSPFLAWLHFYDAHRPYDLPEPYASLYASRPYDGEIEYMDAQVGRILAFLEQRRLLDSTVVIVIGDHGESLGDHGEAGHGIFVYESVMRVPLIIRAPFERLHGRIVDDLTRSVDVLPTLLDLVGIRSPVPFEGTSLVPVMTGRVRTLNLEAYSESLYPLHAFGWSELHALRAGRFKVIAAPRPELYDLESDPFEEHNQYSERRAVGEQMIARLHELQRRSEAFAPAERARVDGEAETADRLATLGYLSRSRDAYTNGGPPPDPKDQIGLLDPGVHP
jgi:arylsulfatase A-like enzyme